ncbi:S1 family peptidase [Pseudonocardia sp. RS11V-5]|uniref:trypsin-like peptidase domain-containing protein n=1 Tax=Pseudonocardia terrae TaxID=2905831 RepID=UPI001E469BFA|nr:trypsin-like peptidase domain-containing protein [Pseudonocardia terrae]MCE3555577.1 S1 family peptidase [Pseudonocardia terrae]
MTPDDTRLIEIKERAAAALMRLPGVTGVGVGGRERDGRPTGEIVIKVFVRRKRAAAELPLGELLPPSFEGVGIDVSVLGESHLDTAPDADEVATIPGSQLVAENDTDATKYRPLIGGSRLQVDLTGAGFGTLGCFLVHETDPNQVFALTNFHVVCANNVKVKPTKDTTRAGQPTNQASSTKCCSDQIGVFAAGNDEQSRDAALVRLDPGTQYLAEVVGIGRLNGPRNVTTQQIAALDYQVFKRGARTKQTGGVVLALNTTHTADDGVTHDNVMVVRPNPNSAIKATDWTYFSDRGDSGSVVVNDNSEVVALHYGAAPDSKLKTNNGLELPITTILGLFGSADGIPVRIATATADGVVQTVPANHTLRIPAELAPALAGPPPGVRVLAPPDVPLLPSTPSPTPELLAGISAQLRASPGGRQIAALWLEHQPELVSLVNEHRRVAIVWQRSGGPALVQTLIRMVDRHDITLPAKVNGQPLASSVSRIHDAFAAQASPGLRNALSSARAALPDLAGLSFPQIIAALGAD